jgi:hypothetical protein
MTRQKPETGLLENSLKSSLKYAPPVNYSLATVSYIRPNYIINPYT